MVNIRESNQSVIIPNMETIAKYGRKFKRIINTNLNINAS